MQNYQNRLSARPILKSPDNLPKILSILPKPPTVHRDVPEPRRDISPLPEPTSGGKMTLLKAIDYDKLTPTQQARMDRGMFGSIELKSKGIYYYYYLRWTDPQTKKRRSTYLSKDYDTALAKIQELTGHKCK